MNFNGINDKKNKISLNILSYSIVFIVKGGFTMRNQEEIIRMYNQHVDMIYRICFMYLKNQSDTEDAVSTTFSKLMTTNKKFEGIEHEKAWLIVTASNVCKNMIRHWWRNRTELFEADLQGETLENSELLNQVLALPNRYKTTIYLYYYEGYSSVEIAQMLNKNESTIRTYLKKGRELLKASLGGDTL